MVSKLVNFNKLDDTEFPILDTVDVYAYKNDYDFKRFDNAQMVIHVLNVPWDMGEAHVGQRTITGIGNVVKFENDEARDNWFKSKRYAETPEQWESGQFDGFKWVTKYREFHNGEDLKIPLPFEIVSKFNYCWIEYEPAASEEYPINYEQGGILKWFMFIRNFQMLSVSTTSCTVKRDTWQTYINHIHFKGAILEQGHYPFTLTSVENYLNNPIENNSGLLCEDVNYGELARVTHNEAIVLNDENIKAIIVSSGNPAANWGSKAADTWHTPNGHTMQDGQPSYFAFAINPAQLSAFLTNANSNTPQFIQTIQCVFFISDKLITLGNSFEFNSITCNWVAQKNSNINLIDLAKEQFGYSNKYAHLAKLYTYPYAALEITNEDGNTTLIKIEDTSGNLALNTSVNLAYPWVNIDGRISGIGGSISKSLTFRNVSAHTFNFSGRWYDHLHSWQIPTFAITQAADIYNDFNTHFDRLQMANNADTANANTVASNATANTNALTSNATAKTNTDASADMSVTNTEIQNTANLNNVLAQADALELSTEQDIYANNAGKNIANTVTEQTANNQIDAQYASAAISSISGLAGGAVSGAASGASLGPVGIAVGAVAGIAGGAIGAITTNMQAAVSNNLTDAQALVQKGANDRQNGVANGVTQEKLDIQTSLNSDNVQINNDNNTTQTANNAGLMKANATRDKDTADANANRDLATNNANAARDYNNAYEAIDNQILQAALAAPEQFGNFADGTYSTTRPMAIFTNVITQAKDDIERAGDYFLRYGYRYDKYIDLNEFNLMPKFTYWKCSDVWVYGLDMADEHMDEIRFFLMGGVTVWRAPEYIGTTSIYENM